MSKEKMESEVFVSKIGGKPEDKISWLLERTNLPKNIDEICIKANLNDYRSWETGSTCDPYILDALLSTLRTRFADASLTLLENNNTSVNADNIFGYLGIDSVAKKYGCVCVNASNEEWRPIEIDGLLFKKLDVPERIGRSFFITFPKLKSHSITKLTCGLKNQMGLFRPKRKIVYHHVVHDLIVDCNLAMQPNLSIVDANLAMEGNYGPTYGSPRKLGLLIASRDVVAADSLCASLFGFRPSSIGYIRKASHKGLGSTKFTIDADFEFNIKQYKMKFSNLLFHLIRKGSGGLQW
jgi:uncharacterized protein (DUF362 family)